MRCINATLRPKCKANPRLEMLAVLEAFSKFVVNNDGMGTHSLKSARLYENVSCGPCNSQGMKTKSEKETRRI